MTFIDRRLSDQITRAGEKGPVEAVIVVDADQDGPSTESAGKLLAKVVEGAIQRTGEHPACVRYLASVNSAVILASVKFIRQVLQDEHIVVASAADVDLFAFLGVAYDHTG